MECIYQEKPTQNSFRAIYSNHTNKIGNIKQIPDWYSQKDEFYTSRMIFNVVLRRPHTNHIKISPDKQALQFSFFSVTEFIIIVCLGLMS